MLGHLGRWIWGLLLSKHQHHEYGFHTTTAAGFAGIDGRFWCNFHLGAGGGYSHSWLDWAGHHGNAKLWSGYGFAYASWDLCHFFLDGMFIGAYNHYKEKRDIEFLIFDREARRQPQRLYFSRTAYCRCSIQSLLCRSDSARSSGL